MNMATLFLILASETITITDLGSNNVFVKISSSLQR